MEDVAVFDSKMLERIGVTCENKDCQTEVIFILSQVGKPAILKCPNCGHELLSLMGRDLPGSDYPHAFTWVSLYKWIQDKTRARTIRFYFRNGRQS